MLLLKQNRSWVSLAPAPACFNDCQIRERIYSDGMMNKIIALPLSGTFKGHKIGMGFGPGIFWDFAGSPRDFFGS